MCAPRGRAAACARESKRTCASLLLTWLLKHSGGFSPIFVDTALLLLCLLLNSREATVESQAVKGFRPGQAVLDSQGLARGGCGGSCAVPGAQTWQRLAESQSRLRASRGCADRKLQVPWRADSYPNPKLARAPPSCARAARLSGHEWAEKFPCP